MHQSLDKFEQLMNEVESKSTFIPKSPKNETVLDLADYNMDPVHEGILQNGINRVSNMLSAKLKSKISNEWKHLDDDEKTLLLRMISGDASVFDEKNSNIDVTLAGAFKDKTLLPTTLEDGSNGIVVNKDVDLSNSGAIEFPNISIMEIKGDLKCSYSSFSSFRYFPSKVKSIEFVKGKGQIETLEGLPETTGKNENNYAIDLKYTKVNSLKGWKSKTAIKGHVSFRGCDLKSVAVDGPIYISGILDLRDNPNISVDTLKSILLKDYSKNQIIVKGGIYHTLESDGYYNSNKIGNNTFTNDNLGELTEAIGGNSAGVLIPQEELWRIGPEIIKQAEKKKSAKSKTSAVDTLSTKIKPEVQSLVSNMASSQLDKNAVSQASQKIVSGMSSNEFRSLMSGLFDNLLKQLTAMVRNSGGDSSQVDKSVETITKVAAENVASQMELFGKSLDEEIKAGNCLDISKINSDLTALLKTVPEIGAGDVKLLKMKAESLQKAFDSKDRIRYTATLKDFINLLNMGILGKPEVSESTLNKIVDNCLGEDSQDESPEDSTSTPEAPTSTEAPVEPTVEPTPVEAAPVPETAPVQEPAKPAPAATGSLLAKVASQKPAVTSNAKNVDSILAKASRKKTAPPTETPVTPTAKKVELPPQVTQSIGSDKKAKGLNRFQKIISAGSSTNGGSEK